MYLLRSKSCPIKSRDPMSGEMKDIGPRAWVEFESLPAGMSPEGDGEISVKVIECDEDLAAAEAENDRMAAEDELIMEEREKRRVDREEERERVKAEKAAAVAAKHPEGWRPPDPDRDRLIALGWTPPPDSEPPMPIVDEAPIDAFVAKHEAEMSKAEIVEWAEKLGVESKGNKADILEVIYAAQLEGGVTPE